MWRIATNFESKTASPDWVRGSLMNMNFALFFIEANPPAVMVETLLLIL